MLDREWFSTAELAGLCLPGFPATKRGVQIIAETQRWNRSDYKDKYWRMRQGKGGGIEYHYSLLPVAAQAKLSLDFMQAEQASQRQVEKIALSRDEMAARFDRLPQAHKDKARDRLKAIQAVEDLNLTGVGLVQARMHVAKQLGISVTSLTNWQKSIENIAKPDRVYYLASNYAGRLSTVECHPEAWEFIKALWLRQGNVQFQDCYERLTEVAAKEGWEIPSARTLERRLNALPEGLRVLAREGPEALKRIFPAQRRDRSVFHALEAVNADGHKLDVLVKWLDGTVSRAVLLAFQDLYSGKILAWRIDRSENKETVRLAFGDLVEKYGIPDQCLLDNGRAFASKWISGGISNRYRFKIKDDDPSGIMKTLGVEIHWATPYAGQSKPIERAFLDFTNKLAKHPKFNGAYTGNNPTTKPENYGTNAVPEELFLKTVAEEVIRHNTRTGRRSTVCNGRSFDETFAESYAKSPIKKATEEQRRLWLMAAEAIGAAKVDGSINLLGNRYWAEFLHAHRGQKLTVRFDPQALQRDLHVYRLDGSYLGAAPCEAPVGFNDVDAARDHARNRGAFIKATRQKLDAERKMTLTQAAALLPQVEESEPPQTKIVRLPVRGNTALQPEFQAEGEEDPAEARIFDAMRQMNRARQGVVHLHTRTNED